MSIGFNTIAKQDGGVFGMSKVRKRIGVYRFDIFAKQDVHHFDNSKGTYSTHHIHFSLVYKLRFLIL